jgi:NUDIX domain
MHNRVLWRGPRARFSLALGANDGGSAILDWGSWSNRGGRPNSGAATGAADGIPSGPLGPTRGHLSLNETMEQCLHREVAEETGLSVRIDRLVGLNQASDGPYVQVIYACKPMAERPTVQLCAGEHDEARWIEPDALTHIGELIPYLAALLRRGMIHGPAT